MRLGWPFETLFKASAAEVDKTTVHCGTCPVSLQCISADGGNGWRFDCCGAAGIEVNGGDGALLLIMDCQKNGFARRVRDVNTKECPLCSGDLAKGHVLGMTDHHRYVSTVHAKVSTSARLALLRKKMPEALALKAHVDARNKKP